MSSIAKAVVFTTLSLYTLDRSSLLASDLYCRLIIQGLINPPLYLRLAIVLIVSTLTCHQQIQCVIHVNYIFISLYITGSSILVADIQGLTSLPLRHCFGCGSDGST